MIDIENNCEFLVFAAHDVSRPFDSSVVSHLLYSVQQRGLNSSVVRVFKNIYAILCVVVKVPTRHGYLMSKAVIQVGKESVGWILVGW